MFLFSNVQNSCGRSRIPTGRMILLLFSVLTFLPEQVEAQEGSVLPPAEITVGIDDNYPPFSFRNPEGHLQGILVDLWDHWSRVTGTKATLIGMNWEEVLRSMQEG